MSYRAAGISKVMARTLCQFDDLVGVVEQVEWAAGGVAVGGVVGVDA